MVCHLWRILQENKEQHFDFCLPGLQACRVAWGKFIQTGTFDSHACFETPFYHTGSTNTRSLWFVDTFDQSQTSIHHNNPCDLVNMKENILFLMYVIWGSFDHVGGTSSSVSGELHPNIKRTHSTKGKTFTS